MAILVEETIREFGYDPNELTRSSKDKVVVACVECGKKRIIQRRRDTPLCASCAKKGKRNGMFGKHLSEEARRHLREDVYHPKGEDNPCFGKHLSDAHRKALSDTLRGDKNPAKRPDVREKIRKSKIGEKNAMYGKCGVKSPRYGVRASEETIEKLSNSHKGIPQSKETIEKRRKTLKGLANHMRQALKKHYEDHPEAREAARMRRRKQKIPTHHTKPELIFEEICKSNNLPFHFVGDSQLWIGKGRKKLNPDFCELNGKKIVIEIFGTYFHSPLQNPNLREDATLAFRKKHYKKYGWKSYFIWDTDLLRPDAELFVLNLLEMENAI